MLAAWFSRVIRAYCHFSLHAAIKRACVQLDVSHSSLHATIIPATAGSRPQAHWSLVISRLHNGIEDIETMTAAPKRLQILRALLLIIGQWLNSTLPWLKILLSLGAGRSTLHCRIQNYHKPYEDKQPAEVWSAAG